MEKLVVVVNDFGKAEVYKRVQVAPNFIEYKAIPCIVFGPPSKNDHPTWIVASIATGVWPIQFGFGKFFDFVLACFV